MYTEEEDSLSALRVQDDDEDQQTIAQLQDILLDQSVSAEEKSNAYDKLQSINKTKTRFNIGSGFLIENFLFKIYFS